MTHDTDAEHTEFEAWLAARRDPAVPVPQSIEQMAVDRYKVVPSHSSMFYPCAVVAGDGQQQLYIGRAVECQNMARKFTGAFLDGAFVALAASPQPPEAASVPQGLFDAIEHGDETHRGWLKSALEAFFLASPFHKKFQPQNIHQRQHQCLKAGR